MRRILTIIFATMVAFGFSASMAYADIAPVEKPKPLDGTKNDDDACTANPLRDASGGNLMLVIVALLAAGGMGGIAWQNKAKKN